MAQTNMDMNDLNVEDQKVDDLEETKQVITRVDDDEEDKDID